MRAVFLEMQHRSGTHWNRTHIFHGISKVVNTDIDFTDIWHSSGVPSSGWNIAKDYFCVRAPMPYISNQRLISRYNRVCRLFCSVIAANLNYDTFGIHSWRNDVLHSALDGWYVCTTIHKIASIPIFCRRGPNPWTSDVPIISVSLLWLCSLAAPRHGCAWRGELSGRATGGDSRLPLRAASRAATPISTTGMARTLSEPCVLVGGGTFASPVLSEMHLFRRTLL